MRQLKLKDEWKGQETLNLILKKFKKEITEAQYDICIDNDFTDDFLKEWI